MEYISLGFLLIPLVFFILGYTGSWRRVIFSAFLTYAALILAAQYGDKLADSDLLADLVGSANAVIYSAIGFISVLVLSLFGLYLAYRITWRPTSATIDRDGATKLLQSLLNGLTGWTLAAVLFTCFLAFASAAPASQRISTAGFSLEGMALRTSQITLKLVEPWLPYGPPEFVEARVINWWMADSG